jgi:erythromycin esterase
MINDSFVANKEELAWLKNNSIKIKTIQAESGFCDLQPIKSLIGDAYLVGLGENTHGTSEVFKIKHRLIEFLVSEMGFTMLSVESLGMPQANKMNDYVLNGIGNPKDLLKEFDLWTFNNQEFLDMIIWMRHYNVSGKGRIQFTSFDISIFDPVLEVMRKFAAENDQTLKSKIDSITEMSHLLRQKADQPVNTESVRHINIKCESLLTYISKNINSYKGIRDETQRKWLLNNARLLVQSTDPRGVTDYYVYRDKCMADNIDWLLENYPNEKIMLWAHIGHLRKEKLFLGGYLSEKFGANYYSIGTVSYTGKYSAVNSNGPSPDHLLIASKPGSFEYSFHNTKIPIFYFDFSKVRQNVPESIWLDDSLNYRGIGALATENQFSPVRISRWFNAIIYIDSTSSTKLLSF